MREQLRLRAILDTSYEAGVGMDVDGHIADWNRQAEVLLGWNASEAMGQLLADLIIPHQPILGGSANMHLDHSAISPISAGKRATLHNVFRGVW